MLKFTRHTAIATALLSLALALAPPVQAMIVGADRIKTRNATILESDLESIVGANAPAAASRVYAKTGITAGTTQTQAGATALTGAYNNVTTVGTAGDGVRLPLATVGQRVTVRNSGANVLRVYPGTSDSINALAVNLSVDVQPLSEKTFTAINTVNWYSGEVFVSNSPTTLTGSLAIKAAASAGNTQTLITNASQAAARTYTIPDAGGNSNFTMVLSGVPAAGGFGISPRNWHTGASPAKASTDGTEYTVVATEVLIAEVFVPANASVTGVALFNASAVAGNIKCGLASSTGAVVATSASTAQSGTDAYQLVPFTTPYAAVGPATYYVLAMGDTGGGTSKINTHTIGTFGAAKQTGQVYATGFTAITPPTTFTTGLGPIASLY